MRLLVDTNVLLDLYQRREPFYEDWGELLFLQNMGDVELWASAKSFTDIHYIASKQLDSRLIQRYFVDSFAYLRICSIDGADIKHAAQAQWKDFEDCIIYQAAQKTKADYILTRNVDDFEEHRIPAITPREFLDIIHEEFEFRDEE